MGGSVLPTHMQKMDKFTDTASTLWQFAAQNNEALWHIVAAILLWHIASGADVEQTNFRGAEAMGLCVDNIKGVAWIPAEPAWDALHYNATPSDLGRFV